MYNTLIFFFFFFYLNSLPHTLFEKNYSRKLRLLRLHCPLHHVAQRSESSVLSDDPSAPQPPTPSLVFHRHRRSNHPFPSDTQPHNVLILPYPPPDDAYTSPQPKQSLHPAEWPPSQDRMALRRQATRPLPSGSLGQRRFALPNRHPCFAKPSRLKSLHTSILHDTLAYPKRTVNMKKKRNGNESMLHHHK